MKRPCSGPAHSALPAYLAASRCFIRKALLTERGRPSLCALVMCSGRGEEEGPHVVTSHIIVWKLALILFLFAFLRFWGEALLWVVSRTREERPSC